MNDLQAQIIGAICVVTLCIQLVQWRHLHRIRRRLQKRLP
jgi:hypothetical protein